MTDHDRLSEAGGKDLMFRPCLLVLCLVLSWALLGVAVAPAQPGDLPPPANWAQLRQSLSGEDIGLPLGTTTAYALGRSLLQRGDTEAALVFLNTAYRHAPDSWLIREVFARGLAEAGYMHDAVRLYEGLVAASPDSLSQRRKFAFLLAHLGQKQAALDQLVELRQRGEHDVALIKQQADLLADLRRVDAAIDVYRQAADQDAYQLEDYYLAAASLLERNQRFDDMAELLREGAERAPASRHLMHSLLRYMVHRGQLEQARAEAAAADARLLNKGLSHVPEFCLELADNLLRQGRLPDAQQVLLDIMAGGERYQEVETLQARIHLSRGNASEALAVLTRASDQWPDQAELRYLQGRALEIQGDLVAAGRQMQAAVDLQPDYAPYRIALLRLYILHHRHIHPLTDETPRQGTLDDVVLEHAIQAAADLDPQDTHGHLILGYVFRRQDDLARACHHFQLAREVNETRLIAGLELSSCLQESGRIDEAVHLLHDLHAEYPDDPSVANNLAYTLAERGEDLSLAERLVRQALKSDPHNAAYLDSLGWVLYQGGDYEGAFHWLVEAVNQRPDDPVVLEHLGLTLYRLGRAQEALDVLHRALNVGGDAKHLQGLIAEIAHER